MNNRPKISSLNEKELAQLLIDCFFLIGREMKLSANETRIFLDTIYKYQGWIYVDVFSEIFSKYAADELPEAESLKPQVSPRFVSKLMKTFFKKDRPSSGNRKEVTHPNSILTPEEKYSLFVQFICVNKCLPGNSDWVTLYEHITKLQTQPLPDGWVALPFYTKWKHAMQAVTAWVYESFNITETGITKNLQETCRLKGIGTRLGESIWNNHL